MLVLLRLPSLIRHSCLLFLVTATDTHFRVDSVHAPWRPLSLHVEPTGTVGPASGQPNREPRHHLYPQSRPFRRGRVAGEHLAPFPPIDLQYRSWLYPVVEPACLLLVESTVCGGTGRFADLGSRHARGSVSMLPPERQDGCAVRMSLEKGASTAGHDEPSSGRLPTGRSHAVTGCHPRPQAHAPVFCVHFCLLSLTFEFWPSCREERSAHCTNEDTEAPRT